MPFPTYRGEFGKLGDLQLGCDVFLRKPSNEDKTAFRKRVANAIAHLANSRQRKYRMATANGGVWVRRVPSRYEEREKPAVEL